MKDDERPSGDTSHVTARISLGAANILDMLCEKDQQH